MEIHLHMDGSQLLIAATIERQSLNIETFLELSLRKRDGRKGWAYFLIGVFLPPNAFVPHDWHQATSKQDDITLRARIKGHNLLFSMANNSCYQGFTVFWNTRAC